MHQLPLLLAFLCLFPANLQAGTGVSFQKKKEKIQGSFSIIERDRQTWIVFSADFRTKKGPDLQLVLSPLAFSETSGRNAMNYGAVSLGLLKSHKGPQEFKVPEDVDLAGFRCVLIHCVKYDRLWGGAPLR